MYRTENGPWDFVEMPDAIAADAKIVTGYSVVSGPGGVIWIMGKPGGRALTADEAVREGAIIVPTK